MKTYQIINWFAVAGHLAASISFIVLYSRRSNFELTYTETYLQWIRIDNETYKGTVMNSTDACAQLQPVGRNLTTANNGDFCIVATTASTGDGVDLGWLIISFHLLSFFFQALAGMTDYCPIDLTFINL